MPLLPPLAVVQHHDIFWGLDGRKNVLFQTLDATEAVESIFQHLPEDRNYRFPVIFSGMFYLKKTLTIPEFTTLLNFGRFEPADNFEIDYLFKLGGYQMIYGGNFEGSFSGLGRLKKGIFYASGKANIDITNCLFADSKSKCFVFSTVSRAKINNCIVGTCDDYLFDYTGGSSCFITGNLIISTDGGIGKFDGCTYLLFSNNLCWKNIPHPTDNCLINTSSLIESVFQENLIHGTGTGIGIIDGEANERTSFLKNSIINCAVGIQVDEDPAGLGEGEKNLIAFNNLRLSTTPLREVTKAVGTIITHNIGVDLV